MCDSPGEKDRHPRLTVPRDLLERLERRQQLICREGLNDTRRADESAESGGDGRRDETAYDDRGMDRHVLHEVSVRLEEVALARRRDAEREDEVHREADAVISRSEMEKKKLSTKRRGETKPKRSKTKQNKTF